MSNKILVTGSTGKTGSRVLSKLNNKNIDVRPASRNSKIPFDWQHDSTWTAALQDIAKIYITFQPDLAMPSSEETIFRFVKLAKKMGVEKLVLLSGRGEKEAIACENVIRNSGITWTIARASFFMQNFSEGFWADGIVSKELLIPAVNVKEPFVDTDDIADIVVAALTDNEHDGKIYELTGPELLSFSDAVQKLSAALRSDIQLIQVPVEAYRNILKTHQVPDDIIWLITYLFTEVLDGRNESVKNDIEQVLNRKPTSFDAYIQKSIKAEFWKNN